MSQAILEVLFGVHLDSERATGKWSDSQSTTEKVYSIALEVMQSPPPPSKV